MNDTLLSNQPGLMDLFRRLKCYVVDWKPEGGYNGPPADHQAAPLDHAEVASSQLADSPDHDPRHVVALDIDHPAWLVKSTTPGHSHLYIDVPGGIEHEAYMDLLAALAACGVIEDGYCFASKRRMKTFLRFPWVKKQAA